MSSSSTPNGKGKAKAKTSPPISAGKRPLSLEDQITNLQKKIRRHESIVEDSYSELGILEEQLKKKERLDAFIDMMSSDSCVICSRDLSECIGEPDMALVSYECNCKKTRVVHLGCFTREFRCCCSVIAKIGVKSPSGKEVDVKVSEVTDVLGVFGGVDDSDVDLQEYD